MAVVDLRRYDAFLFDCDGVLWTGSQLISGAGAALQALQNLGKKVLFVTNNSFQSPGAIREKISRVGFSCAESQVYCSSRATAWYLRKRYPAVRKVYLVGEESFRSELRSQGLEVTRVSDFPAKRISSLEQLKAMRPDQDVGAVVVGLHTGFNYLEAYYASMCLQAGAKLIASNNDDFLPLRDGVRMPGSGCFVRFMENAANVTAEVVGKPEPFFFELARDLEHIDPRRTLMVGDSLATDISFATRAGIDSALVLSGVTKADHIAHADYQPTYVLDSIANLIPA